MTLVILIFNLKNGDVVITSICDFVPDFVSDVVSDLVCPIFKSLLKLNYLYHIF